MNLVTTTKTCMDRYRHKYTALNPKLAPDGGGASPEPVIPTSGGTLAKSHASIPIMTITSQHMLCPALTYTER